MARSPITLGAAVEAFLQDQRDKELSHATVRSYTGVLERFARLVGPELGTKSLSRDHIKSYFYGSPVAAKKVYKPSTFNHHLAVVSLFLAACQDEGWVRPGLLKGTQRVKYIKKQYLRLSPEELLFSLNIQAHPRDRFTMALAMNTALRASEMVTLRLADVMPLGKGYVMATMHKNYKSDKIPVTQELDAELRDWLNYYTAEVGKLEPDMFLIPAKGRPSATDAKGRFLPSPDAVLVPYVGAKWSGAVSPVKRALEALGYPTEGEGLHTIRRSVATAMYYFLANHEDPAIRLDAMRIVQRALNHSSIQITEHYIGLGDREKARLDAALMSQPFLTSMVSRENVVPLRAAQGG